MTCFLHVQLFVEHSFDEPTCGFIFYVQIFSAKRGHLKFAIQSQEFFRTLQRYYSNAYMDAYKQAAINLYVWLSSVFTTHPFIYF